MKKENFTLNKMIGFYVNRTAFLMSEGISKRFSKNGFSITAQDFGIMSLLWNNDGQTHMFIAEKMLRDKTTITRRIDGLVKKGYLFRQTDNKDKRIVRVFVTEEGNLIKNKLINILLDFHKEILGDIPENEVEITKKTLEKIINSLSEGF